VLAEIGGGSEVAGRVGFVAVDEQEDDHLARHGEIDIALDSHPFSGATTSFDALWMGVPVVTLAGGTFLSRMTASHLIPLGLADLVASTPEEYVNIAVALALDPPRLAALRSSLRERLLASPLMDATASAKGFEALLRRLWQRWASETAG
jgi:predicted O-linked N-acetylglucosamine transferase (SPINDLY family)